MNTCQPNHLLVAHATPKKEAENAGYIRLLGQSLPNDLAIIYAVAIWRVVCIICRTKNIRPLGQCLTNLAIVYAAAIWLDICIVRRAKKQF